MAELNDIYNRGLHNHFLGNYKYYAASESADTVGDWREFYDNTMTFKERCTVANAAKAGGTWKKVETLRYATLTDSNLLEPVGSYIDLTAGLSGWGRITFGDALGFAEFIFDSAGVVTLITNSNNVFTSAQGAANHVIIKDNGTNVRIVNELGTSQIFNVEIKHTN